jgi:hypothetical protein
LFTACRIPNQRHKTLTFFIHIPADRNKHV